MRNSENLKGFILDCWRYNNALGEHKILPGQKIECSIPGYSRKNFKSSLDVACFFQTKVVLMKLHELGKTEYSVHIRFLDFIDYFIKKIDFGPNESHLYTGHRYRLNLNNNGSKKYQRKAHHEKKIESENSISRKNWRIEKKINKDKAKSYYAYNDCWWTKKRRVVEKVFISESNIEIRESYK